MELGNREEILIYYCIEICQTLGYKPDLSIIQDIIPHVSTICERIANSGPNDGKWADKDKENIIKDIWKFK